MTTHIDSSHGVLAFEVFEKQSVNLEVKQNNELTKPLLGSTNLQSILSIKK